MRALGTAVLLTALAGSAACGPASPSSSRSTVAPRPGTCPGAVVAHVDLDGDGLEERVRLCGDRLVADIDGHRTEVRGTDLTAGDARAVVRPGAADLLLVGSRHRGGGWQPHLFTADGGRLAEVLLDGRPVLPRVTTSRGHAPLGAGCAPDGAVTVTAGVAHQPPGIVLAWDLTRTTYDVRGAAAVRRDSRVVRVAAADPVLRRDRPDLFDRTLFTGCG